MFNRKDIYRFLQSYTKNNFSREEFRPLFVTSLGPIAFVFYNIGALVLNATVYGLESPINLSLIVFTTLWIALILSMIFIKSMQVTYFFWLTVALIYLQLTCGMIMLGPESFHYFWFLFIIKTVPSGVPRKRLLLSFSIIFLPATLLFFWGAFFQESGLLALDANYLSAIRDYNLVLFTFLAIVEGPVIASFLIKLDESIEFENARSESLLLNILPEEIANRLKTESKSIAEGFETVTVLFADLVNFTTLSEKVSPTELVSLLDRIFSEFDHLVEMYDLEKIKTIGDAYMVVGGVPVPKEKQMAAILDLALAMQQVMDEKFTNSDQGEKLQLRIGISSGPAVAGIIGNRKFAYDIWGDSVNTASRMESHGVPGRIQVSEEIFHAMNEQYSFESRGEIEIKGKGNLPVWYLNSKIV